MDVGLPDGQMGNSEVGHTNIGAGRIVYQELTRITKAIQDGDFFRESGSYRARSTSASGLMSTLHILSACCLTAACTPTLTTCLRLLELAKRRNGLRKVCCPLLHGRPRHAAARPASSMSTALQAKIDGDRASAASQPYRAVTTRWTATTAGIA